MTAGEICRRAVETLFSGWKFTPPKGPDKERGENRLTSSGQAIPSSHPRARHPIQCRIRYRGIRMALSDTVKHQAETLLRAFCERRVPATLRDKIRLTYGFRGNSVTLFENRPGFTDPGKWIVISSSSGSVEIQSEIKNCLQSRTPERTY